MLTGFRSLPPLFEESPNAIHELTLASKFLNLLHSVSSVLMIYVTPSRSGVCNVCSFFYFIYMFAVFLFLGGGGGGVGSVGKQVMNVLFSNFELHEIIQIISM